MFAENISKNPNLNDSGISLPVFPSRTNLKLLNNISVTPEMVKKVMNHESLSKASGLKNTVSQNFLTYYLNSSTSIKCLKESCFPDCWKVSSVVPVFKNVGERSTAKNYCPVNFSVVFGT